MGVGVSWSYQYIWHKRTSPSTYEIPEYPFPPLPGPTYTRNECFDLAGPRPRRPQGSAKQALQLQSDVKTLGRRCHGRPQSGNQRRERRPPNTLVKRFKAMGVHGAISDSKTPYLRFF